MRYHLITHCYDKRWQRTDGEATVNVPGPDSNHGRLAAMNSLDGYLKRKDRAYAGSIAQTLEITGVTESYEEEQ